MCHEIYLNCFLIIDKFSQNIGALCELIFSREFSDKLPSKMFNMHSPIFFMRLGLGWRDNKTHCRLSSKHKARKKSATFYSMGQLSRFDNTVYFLHVSNWQEMGTGKIFA